jgi:hypothetical protein
MIRIACRFDTPLHRVDHHDYLRPLELDVLGWDDAGQEVLLGRVGADKLLWFTAELDGVPAFDICDEDSQGWHDVYKALTHKGRIRDDLGVDEFVDHVIFIHRIVLHPDLEFCRQGVLDTIATLFGQESLTVLWKDLAGFSESELAQLGFRKIAGQDLIVRHSSYRTVFSDLFPKGQPADFTARAEQVEWVREQWGRDE